MRKIYSQSVDSTANQNALTDLAKSLGVAQSRVLEKIISSISADDLTAIAIRKFSLKTVNIIQLDRATAQVIQDEVARSLSLLSNRIVDAASDGARSGVISIISESLGREDQR